MIFTPSAKALVYRELQFVTTSVPAPVRIPPIRQIFDEVAQDIRTLFLEPSESCSPMTPLETSKHS